MVVIGDGSEPVGRAPERARIAAALATAVAGRPAVVAVDGEPGIGKTSLVAWEVARGPWRTVVVSGDEAEIDLEWGVVDQILRVDPTAAPADGRADAAGTGAVLAAALGRLAADGPLAVVVDDAHWADLASLRALTFAIRRLGDLPVVIAITCRTDGLDRMPPGLLARADATAGRVTLGPLDRAAIAELGERAYGRPLSAGAGERLHAHTGGNPLHTLALLDELPFAVVAGRASLPAPRSYATFVTALLAGCSPRGPPAGGRPGDHGSRRPPERGRRGRRCRRARPGGGRAGGRRPGGGVEVAARAAGRRRGPVAPVAVVRPCVGPGEHPRRPLALRARRPAPVRGRRDERRRAPPPPPRRGARSRCGPGGGGLGTRRPADRAGRPGAASRLRLAAAPVATASAREELVLDAALELIQAGEPLGALTGEIDQLADSARRSLVLGREALMGGRRDEARAWLERAWGQSSVDPGLASIAAPIADMLALAALDRGDWAGTRDWAERAVARSSSSGLSATLLAHGLVMTRQAPEAERRLSALVDAGADQPLRAIDARVGRGVARLWANDLDGAVDDLRAAAAHLGRQGSLVAQAEVDAHLAEVALRAGRWAEALDLASSATAVVDDADAVWLGALAHGVLAFVLAARGDVAAADRHAALAAGSARATGLMAAGLWAHHATLRSAVAAGDHAEVVRLGDRMAHEPWGEVPEGVHHWRAATVDALVAVGRIDDATSVARDLEDEARNCGDHAVGADAARACGTVAAARRDDAEATAAFAAGLALDPVRSRPYERARLEMAAGAHLRRTGHRRAAADLLAVAAERLRALGATPWAERCQREIDGCGLRPRRRHGQDDELTAREELVAGVVARGLSNREVAAELGISVKTVEHHLGRIYTKLGLRSRTQLAVHLVAAEQAGRGVAEVAP